MVCKLLEALNKHVVIDIECLALEINAVSLCRRARLLQKGLELLGFFLAKILDNVILFAHFITVWHNRDFHDPVSSQVLSSCQDWPEYQLLFLSPSFLLFGDSHKVPLRDLFQVYGKFSLPHHVEVKYERERELVVIVGLIVVLKGIDDSLIESYIGPDVIL